ncbi:MAG: hypothetical protein KDI09_16245 [Halioglobus sp.]|nr:hypothetical protein [Halioglobus sp.]
MSCSAEFGQRFLQLYDFDVHTGCWVHLDDRGWSQDLSLESAFRAKNIEKTALPAEHRKRLYRSYLGEAREQAELLCVPGCCDSKLPGELGELQYFVVNEPSNP